MEKRGREHVAWGRGIGGPEALGIRDVHELFEPGHLPTPDAQVLESRPGFTRLRFPLPGTPRGEAAPEPRPGRASGWALLERWERAPLGPLVAARFTRPRSMSLAERRWNLLCHLRAHGVGAPEPLAVGSHGEGLVARRSFLVTREVAGLVPLAPWLAIAPADARRRGLAALGGALARLFAAAVHVPELGTGDFRIAPFSVGPAEGEAGGELTDAGSVGACEEAAPGGLRRRRLPPLFLARMEGAGIRARLGLRELRRMLGGLLEGIPGARQEAGGQPGRDGWAEVRRTALRATRGLPPAQREELLRDLSTGSLVDLEPTPYAPPGAPPGAAPGGGPANAG